MLTGAARALSAIAAGGHSADAALALFADSPERAAIRAVTLGSVRWYLRLQPAVHALLAPGQRVRPEVDALLVAAAHQVEYSRNPPEASVHAAVDAVRALGQARASGLVNAVLRRFVAERAGLFARLDADPAVASAHPAWLVQALQAAWPSAARMVLAANNEHPPLVLRVNPQRGSRAAYLQALSAAGLPARALEWCPSAVRVEKPVAVESLPGFSEGWVSVQDGGAQLAAPLLAPAAGMRVLDACAAPGGKLSHLLELGIPGIQVTAVDIDAERMRRVQENLERTGGRARLEVLDVRRLGGERPEASLPGAPFDRVLVDVPCSSTGVIRRHPDIKLLRRPADVPAFAAAQLAILRGAFAVLAPAGRLLYCTCSVLPEENEALVRGFLATEPRARAVPVSPALAPGAIGLSPGVQLLPGADAGSDGFYYACIEKTTAGDTPGPV